MLAHPFRTPRQGCCPMVSRGASSYPRAQLTIIANKLHYVGNQGIAMATMNVSLPGPMKNWVEKQYQTERFSNASDYVRHLIRRDQEYARALEQLQTLVDQGLQSGAPQEFDFEDFLRRKQEGYDTSSD